MCDVPAHRAFCCDKELVALVEAASIGHACDLLLVVVCLGACLYERCRTFLPDMLWRNDQVKAPALMLNT